MKLLSAGTNLLTTVPDARHKDTPCRPALLNRRRDPQRRKKNRTREKAKQRIKV
jgi:hypothetical protein